MAIKKNREDIEEARSRGHRDFSGYNISFEDLSNMELHGCDFRNSDLTNTSFEGSSIHGCFFKENAACDTNFSKSKIWESHFINCDLRKANFDECEFSIYQEFILFPLIPSFEKGRQFDNSNLRGASFADIKITSGSRFGYHFDEIDFSNCRFDGTKLEEVNFRNSCFQDASFTQAYLPKSDFSNADCRNADFTECNLRHCKFFGADLRGAILKGSTLSGLEYDNSTKWPDGFDPRWSISP